MNELSLQSGSERYGACDGEAAVSWSYDSPAKGGLHHAHYPGRVAKRMDHLKWTSRAAAPVFAIMLCGSNSARAAASQCQIPCADGLSRQRIHVTLRKTTKPRKEIAMMQPTPNETRTHTDELVDIRKVSVDKNLPKEEPKNKYSHKKTDAFGVGFLFVSCLSAHSGSGAA